MACLTVPHLRDPESVDIGSVRSHDVAQTPGHGLCAFQEKRCERVSLSGLSPAQAESLRDMLRMVYDNLAVLDNE